MIRSADKTAAARALLLARAGLTRHGAPSDLPSRFSLIDVERQRATLIENGEAAAAWAVSTSRFGIGGQEGSNRTPPGWHRIARKIGGDATLGTRFVSREPTGEIWQGERSDDDLILTRILTLDGLEPGVNQGGTCDSLARYIYIHGTNQENSLGWADSHGCVRMANDDVIALFDQVQEGDLVLIAESSPLSIPDPLGGKRFHFAGVAGSGMSALAQFQVMCGGRVSGSDRAFDHGERSELRAALESLGIAIVPQDGSGISEDCAALVISTAVEDQVPDVAAAKQLGIPIVHRSELLAHFVAAKRTIAVTGTSGKSTVTAMIFEILRGVGRDPSVITGADLPSLQAHGLPGNAFAGASDLLVVEADESDGSLVRYAPAIGVILNLQRDHKEMAEVEEMFATLRARAREGLVVGEDDNLDELAGGALRFGFGPKAEVRAEHLELGSDGSKFSVEGTPFTLHVPGKHNVANALAAIAAARTAGVEIAAMVPPLANFTGVARRFQTVGRARGVEVIDDFAHNAEKIAAALATARLRGTRVLAVYQPHGYGPTRFLWRDFVETFARELRPQDRLFMLEIFYAGGTAARDFSAADIVKDIASHGALAEFASSRANLAERIAAKAQQGDVVLVMGARDPSLTDFARTLVDAIEKSQTADTATLDT